MLNKWLGKETISFEDFFIAYKESVKIFISLTIMFIPFGLKCFFRYLKKK